VPVQIFYDGIEITGLKQIPEGEITRVSSLFPNMLFVLRHIDSEKLGKHQFCYGSNINNEVSGGGFKFYVDYEKQTDMLTVKYTNRAIREFRSLQISLRDYVEGVLCSMNKFLESIIQTVPERKSDEYYLGLEDDYNFIKKWYCERYGIK
jgi:hypothetical protein